MYTMIKKFFLLHILFTVISVWSFSTPNPPKLDVLIITIDTLRADYLSCYNKSNIKTHNIDRLANDGLLFLRAFAHNVLTLPSHINILTGTYPFIHGVRDNAGFRLGEESLLISEILKNEDYRTAAFIGAFPLDDRFGLNQGFDLYDDFYGDTSHIHTLFFVERPAEKVIDSAIEWISSEEEKFWFCWIHLFDPHIPYNPPLNFKNEYPNDHYGGEIAYVDQQLGRLFQFLDERQNRGYPLIIITSDHGESLGEHGEMTHGVFAYNSTLHIPLIIFQPKIFPKPKVINEMVRHIDIMPTILEALNLKIPDVIQGKSMLPLIRDCAEWKNETCYFESLSPYLTRNWAPLYGLIGENHKFISLPIPELYDLQQDFNEMNNIEDERKKTAEILMKDLDNLLGKEKQPVMPRQEDRDTLEKLQSLGYVADHLNSQKKQIYSAEDDPKNLIHLDNKMHEGMLYFKEGKLKKAQKILEEIIQKKPDFARVYEHLSFVYNESGQLEKATELLESAVRRIPNNPILMSKLAVLLQEGGELQKAEALLEDLIQSSPHDVEILNYLGVTYWKLGKNQDALDVFCRAIALDKGYASVYSNIGSVYLNQKDYLQAETFYKKALFYDKNLASAYNGVGVVSSNRNNKSQAIQNWKKAVDLDKNQHDALYNLCIVLTQSNQFREAIKYTELFISTASPRKYSSDIEKMKVLLERLKAALKEKK